MTITGHPRSVRAAASVGALLVVLATGACGSSEPAPAPTSAPAPAPAAPAGPVSAEQAGQIAVGQYGGRVLNVEPDTANGTPTWEVEVADSREGRIEVDVAQDTGAVVEMERD